MLSSIINLSLKPWHIAAIVVVGIFVAMTRNAPGAISGLDLIAYESAFDLFIRGGDPYSYGEMFVRQKEWMVQRDGPVMVWNPPSMFILFWPLLHVAPNIAPGVSTIASLCCALALAFLGFHAVTTYRLKGVPLIPFIVTAVLLPPFVEEIAIGQNTSWVALPVALGCYLVALQGWSWTAGLLLSWAICKPHDFFLPLVVVGMELARRRDWRTCLGGALGLLVPVVCAELIHPGIWRLWLYREQWPQQALGANVSALIRIASGDFEALSLPLIVPLSIILGLVVYRIGIRELGLRTFTERYMLAFLVWPFFSPYGFLSDQVVLILPVAFFVQRILSMSDNVRALQLLAALTMLVGLTYLMDIVVLFQTRLSWFFFAPSVLVLVRSFGRSVTEVAAE